MRALNVESARTLLNCNVVVIGGFNLEVQLYSLLTVASARYRSRFCMAARLFQLTGEEFNDLKSQFVTSSWGGMRRALPYAFTEQGIAMLSGVLKSPRAIRVNVARHVHLRSSFIRCRLPTLNSHASWTSWKRNTTVNSKSSSLPGRLLADCAVALRQINYAV
jgi:hypothetical protein